MIDLVNSIPVSVWLLINAVIASLMGFYFSRKKTAATVANLITQGAERNIKVYEKRLELLEAHVSKLEFKNGKLTIRISSIEQDAQVYSQALQDLQQQHEALQKKMRGWNQGIQILIKQIEKHDSRPDWRPNGD